MKRILLFLILFINCAIYSHANIGEINRLLNSCLNRIKVNIDLEYKYTINEISVEYISDTRFILSMKYLENYINKQRICKIEITSPYFVKNGEWIQYNGEYKQEGDLRIVTISGNPDYLTDITLDCFDVENSNKLLNRKLIRALKLEFPDVNTASKFVLAINEIQGSRIDNTPWYRSKREKETYSNFSSKDLYDNLVGYFSEYNIQSEQVHSTTECSSTKNIRIKYNHPNIIISYIDISNTPGINLQSGKFTVSIPIHDAMFENGVGFLGGKDEEKMLLSSKSGIEVMYKGRKTIVEEYCFYASRIICDKILKELRAFKSKVLSENFVGRYGYSVSKPNANVKPKTISNNYEQ